MSPVLAPPARQAVNRLTTQPLADRWALRRAEALYNTLLVRYGVWQPRDLDHEGRYLH